MPVENKSYTPPNELFSMLVTLYIASLPPFSSLLLKP